MTRDEIMGGLREAFLTVRPNMDLSKVTEESRLIEDLGLDSLSMLLLSLAIEQKFNFQFPSELRFRTVDEVIDTVNASLS